MNYTNKLSAIEIDRIIEMAWEDRTTFDAIETQFGLNHQEVIVLMRHEMKERSFKMWRKRMTGRSTKHQALRNYTNSRFKCDRQRTISNNKITKR
ncbi:MULTISPECIES: TIGR03643 family protein [Pedobacter]|uniref:TIGR03643 family protein n=1 Tax=Pedobacter TaxID=84567 RepID=UPI001E5FB0FD|nr:MULTISPECIES: TIGR03643 family protein [Pedobacter]